MPVKTFKAKLCYLLLLLMVFFSGCWWGGSGTYHHPRKSICCDTPWDIKVMYKKDPNNWRINLKKKSSSFSVHYRVTSSDEFFTVPMVVEKLEPKLGRAYLKADMPPISCDSVGSYVEYYYDTASPDYRYNKSKVYQAYIGD